MKNFLNSLKWQNRVEENGTMKLASNCPFYFHLRNKIMRGCWKFLSLPQLLKCEQMTKHQNLAGPRTFQHPPYTQRYCYLSISSIKEKQSKDSHSRIKQGISGWKQNVPVALTQRIVLILLEMFKDETMESGSKFSEHNINILSVKATSDIINLGLQKSDSLCTSLKMITMKICSSERRNKGIINFYWYCVVFLILLTPLHWLLLNAFIL